eukprot:8478115-Pyramimonas_sp.AAC.1
MMLSSKSVSFRALGSCRVLVVVSSFCSVTGTSCIDAAAVPESGRLGECDRDRGAVDAGCRALASSGSRQALPSSIL